LWFQNVFVLACLFRPRRRPPFLNGLGHETGETHVKMSSVTRDLVPVPNVDLVIALDPRLDGDLDHLIEFLNV
jgi:hypothetical protein